MIKQWSKNTLLGKNSFSQIDYIDALKQFSSDLEKQKDVQNLIRENNFEVLVDLILTREDYVLECNLEVVMELEKTISSIGQFFGKDAVDIMLSKPEYYLWSFKAIENYKSISSDFLIVKLIQLTIIFMFADDIGKMDSDDIDVLVYFLFEIAKEYHDDVEEENITPFSIVCLIAISKLFNDPKSNIVLSHITSNQTIKELSIVFVSVLNQSSASAPTYLSNSLSFFHLLFSDYRTANLFYINDLRVIIDIILREITNLSEGDDFRPQYLNVLYQLLNNCTDYLTILHRKDELFECLNTVCRSESMDSESKEIAEKILTKCEFIFSLDSPLL